MRPYGKFSNGAIPFQPKERGEFCAVPWDLSCGDPIRLSNDRLAVVKKITHNNILAPEVVVAYGVASDMKVKPKTMDLAEYNLKRPENPAVIKQIEDPKK